MASMSGETTCRFNHAPTSLFPVWETAPTSDVMLLLKSHSEAGERSFINSSRTRRTGPEVTSTLSVASNSGTASGDENPDSRYSGSTSLPPFISPGVVTSATALVSASMAAIWISARPILGSSDRSAADDSDASARRNPRSVARPASFPCSDPAGPHTRGSDPTKA